jgi:hypothetical protein
MGVENHYGRRYVVEQSESSHSTEEGGRVPIFLSRTAPSDILPPARSHLISFHYLLIDPPTRNQVFNT